LDKNSLHKKCLVCGSTSISSLKDYEKHYLVNCKNCGFVFSQAIPTAEELENHYKGYGRNDYLSPITIKRYHELLDKMEPYRKTNRLIDVGCGIGYFLEVAKERGWEVYGTEFTDEAVEICQNKGISMHQGPLDPENYQGISFDIITSFEVIEHINNPIEELTHFYELLRKGGLVYVTTPNFNSLLRYRLKEKYNVIAYPEHLSYYTPKTLKKVFRNTGFKTQKIQSTGISLSRLKSSKGKTTEAPISEHSTDEHLRNQAENKWYMKAAKNIVNSFLTFTGKGDSLKGWFIKR
jgi:2-polyprenyl-3-methyl-5-hydroxy-6-metoxy-1,4-benzoquinol methylase